MIVITVALRSAISSDRDKVLGVMHITNDGTGGDTLRHYDGVVKRAPDFEQPTRRGHVMQYPAKRLTIWYLVARMLKDMGYD